MYRKCPHCSFKNPSDVGDCLICHRDLPITRTEFKERIENAKRAVKGDFSGIAKSTTEEMVTETVSSIKYRFHPLWIIRVKLHKLKQAFISLLWIFGIIIALVIFGAIYNLLTRGRL